jgi:hypothetical protein
MIKALEEVRIVQVIKEFQTEGHRPLHVLADDYETTYVAKCGSGRKPENFLINEILCHYFLKEWSIPTPDIAILKILPSILPPDLAPKYKNYKYDGLWFGSKFIEKTIDVTEFIKVQRKPDFRRIYNPNDLLLIGLFDIWVENDDRKPSNSNLLLIPHESRSLICAIDHSFTFCSMNHHNLPIGVVSASFNDTILHSSIASSVLKYNKINRNSLKTLEERFYLCLQNCENNYKQVANNMPEYLGFTQESVNVVYEFLFDHRRNKKVFEDFCSKVK